MVRRNLKGLQISILASSTVNSDFLPFLHKINVSYEVASCHSADALHRFVCNFYCSYSFVAASSTKHRTFNAVLED